MNQQRQKDEANANTSISRKLKHLVRTSKKVFSSLEQHSQIFALSKETEILITKKKTKKKTFPSNIYTSLRKVPWLWSSIRKKTTRTWWWLQVHGERRREKRESHKTTLCWKEGTWSMQTLKKHRKVLDGSQRSDARSHAHIISIYLTPAKHGSNICFIIRKTAFLVTGLIVN